MSGVARRDVLKGAGAIAALHSISPRVGAQPVSSPFSWGVASFDPTTDSVLLWTRIEPSPDDRPVVVTWSLTADPELSDVVASGSVEADGDSDWCVTVEATDLPAGGVWWFAFAAPDGSPSPLGRTRTMPAGADRLRLGLASCARFASERYGVYRALSDRELDVVVHVGDYIYEDGGSDVRSHEPPRELVTLDDYRTRYRQHRQDRDLQALHARHPMVAVWDDHEIAGNAWRDGAPGHDPSVQGPWHDRLVAAGRARQEWVPGRTETTDDGRLKAWRTLALGELAELVVLDTRTWGRDRQPVTATDMEASPSALPRSMLGDDQHAFVADRLRSSDRAPWVLVANQVMYNPTPLPVPTKAMAEGAEAGGMLVAAGVAINPDQWDGYPQARDALNAAVGDRGGVVVLSGDIHSSWAWEGPAQAGGAPTMVEVVAPSVSSVAGGDRFGVAEAIVEAGLRATQRGLSFVELRSHGYVVVDLTPDDMQAEWWFVDPSDARSEALGAARRTSRVPPMRFEDVSEARPDPEPTTTATSSPSSTTAVVPGAPDLGRSEDDRAPLLVGAGALVVAAAAAVVGVRRRRR